MSGWLRFGHRFAAPLCIGLSLLGHTIPSARADLLLNEVLYDPEGPDEGLEFVELWNPDSTARSLEGITVETGDGSRPGSWTTIYIGTAGDSVPPRAPFLISGASLRAPIQNGPDAMRLTRFGSLLDLLGYGALTSAELYRGAPAEDAPAGQSLARVRDGAETGSNAADWAAEPEPTPGRPNHPDVRLSIARDPKLDPEVPWPGDAATLFLVVRNRGRLTVEAARWRTEARIRRPLAADSGWSSAPAALAPGATLAPGESAQVRCSLLVPSPGRFDLRVILRDLQGSASRSVIADTIVVRSRSTAGPLAVNEIAFRDRGGGEWVELLALEDIPDVGAYALTDAGGRAYPVDGGAAPRALSRGRLLVLAESPARLGVSYALPESLIAGCRGGWPALNDTDGDDGFADRVRVLDPDGVLSDAVPYRGGAVERAGSLERLGAALPSATPGSWSESIDPSAGTPGRTNSMLTPPEGGAAERLLFASPRVVRRRPGAPVTPVVLAFGKAARGARVRVLVHDLLGRARRHLVDGQRILGEAAFVWDGRDDQGEAVPAGVYVARAETIPDGVEPARSGNLSLTVIDR